MKLLRTEIIHCTWIDTWLVHLLFVRSSCGCWCRHVLGFQMILPVILIQYSNWNIRSALKKQRIGFMTTSDSPKNMRKVPPCIERSMWNVATLMGHGPFSIWTQVVQHQVKARSYASHNFCSPAYITLTCYGCWSHWFRKWPARSKDFQWDVILAEGTRLGDMNISTYPWCCWDVRFSKVMLDLCQEMSPLTKIIAMNKPFYHH